jgi:hypothetical protein
MPVLVSFAVSDGWTAPLAVIGFFVVLELISNNVLEPWLYGSSAGVSPLAVIVTAIFWTWIWGPVGLLLATPLTVCMVVLGKHVPQLQFLHVLLGEDPGLEPHAMFYHRLLTMDQEGAAEVAEKMLATDSSLAEVYDTVVMPGLALVEMDRHAGNLDERRAQSMHGALRMIIDDLAELAQRPPQPAKDKKERSKSNGDAQPQPTEPPPVLPADMLVVSLPAHDEADELAGAMLAHVVRSSCARCEPLTLLARTSGLVDLMQQHEADVVFVSAIPPAAVAHARHVYKRLNSRFPGMQLAIGLWAAGRPPDDGVRARIGCGPDVPIVTSLRDALAHLVEVGRAIERSRLDSAREPA